MARFTFITNQRNKFSSELSNDIRYWSLSAITFSYYQVIRPIIALYVNGKTLDAGAGRLNGKALLEGYCSDYVSMDISAINGDIQIISDIQDMGTIGDAEFDTVYSSQVLEHVPKPWMALSEMHRVLKPGGYAIVSVPLFNGLHEEPHDYYRYTPYGLNALMQQAGFKIVHEATAGGLLSFLSHVSSLLLVCSFWAIPGLRWVILLLNKLMIVFPALWLDNLLKTYRKFPACIIAVGMK